jgi:hypothetical protein
MAFQDDYTSAAIKLKRREAKLTQFISQTGRTRLRERESTGVWSVGEAAKARGAAQSSHTQWLKSINATDTSLNTLAKYYSGKYNNTPEYQLLTRYAKDVQGGWISPLAGFGNYKTAIQRIDNELVGKTSVSGIVITGQSKHLIQRIIGTASDPEKHSPRSGVEVDDLINAVLNGKFKAPKTDEITGARSQLHFNDVCAVSINPDTGVIIQCNPY